MPDQTRAHPASDLPWLSGSRRAVVDYPGTDPLAPSLARRAARAELHRWGLPGHAIESAQQVIAELVTNAVVHGGDGPLTLDLAEDGHSRLRITVTDRGRPPGTIQAGTSDIGAESGRGLAIVAALAEDWDHHHYPYTATAVWAVVAVRATDTSTDDDTGALP
jgi:anti-sigma regulatory factor (Ser/Thr protein kinase)